MWLVSSLCCDVESSVLIFFLIFSCPSSHSVSRSTSLFPCQDHIHAWHYRFFLPAILGEMSGTKQIADGLWTRECWINPLPRIQKWAFLELYLCSLPEYACLMEDQGEALVIFFFLSLLILSWAPGVFKSSISSVTSSTMWAFPEAPKTHCILEGLLPALSFLKLKPSLL